jgi:hypothetical protein
MPPDRKAHDLEPFAFLKPQESRAVRFKLPLAPFQTDPYRALRILPQTLYLSVVQSI